MSADRRPALFLDRDGVLNEDVGYPHRVEDLRWTPGAQSAVRLANDAGWWVFVVTNQSGVARAYFDMAAVDRFHDAMSADLARAGARVDRFYVCPFHPDAVEARWRHANHPDRKPNPGLLLRAMAEQPVDGSRSLMIGDKRSDLAAARQAGVRGVLYAGGDLDVLVGRLLAQA
jgi:D-glycero-D-manno-heptose 1,7-bisphosphate phosphatase